MAEFRAENADHFSLADETNEALMALACRVTESARSMNWSAEAVCARVLLRACGIFQGVVLLAERGMFVEGRILSRGLIECAFAAAALAKQPTKFLEMLKSDHHEARRRQTSFILAAKLISDDSRIEELKSAYDELEKGAFLNQRAVAELGPIVGQYLAYQRLSDGAVHLSATSLEHHVRRSGNEWMFKWGPGTPESVAATLFHAMLPAISIGIAITEFLNDNSSNNVFAAIGKELHSLPEPAMI